jgi:hypothetical protein
MIGGKTCGSVKYAFAGTSLPIYFRFYNISSAWSGCKKDRFERIIDNLLLRFTAGQNLASCRYQKFGNFT